MRNKILLAAFVAVLCCAPAWAGTDGTTSLKETVALAVKSHPKVKAMLHNREAMSRTLSASLGRFFPSLDLSSSYGLQQYDSQDTRLAGRDQDSKAASDSTLTLTQNVFDGMERLSRYDMDKARLDSAEGRLFDNVETIGLDAVRAHIDVHRERMLAHLAVENVASHKDILSSIAERVAAGAGSRADEMQARGRLARAETTLITYEGNLRTVEANYLRMTGHTPGVLAVPGFAPEFMPASLEEVMERTLADNPKLRVYKAEVAAASESRDMVDARMYPDVDIKLSSRYTDNLDSSRTYLQDNRAMLALSWNLFSGGSDYNDSKAAEARIDEAQANLQDTTDDLVRQVSSAWSEYVTAAGQVAKHTEALQYSRESRDMYMLQFNVGQRSLLDVLDAVNEVFSNAVLLESARNNQIFTLYKLRTLEGKLVATLELGRDSYDSSSE
ncbi:TolC family outer membrane protein [Pseudodesulfovibrio tunisiensis]|uniref:TolC family outer membrane protein n=1 Tax=Pseudodesulfovibrio tunisiensis TaxID=463192 RepID=UPI001FB34D26|nr:TolC family outer membrane protein [Pseudodesulfovibrio tunisiensis]